MPYSDATLALAVRHIVEGETRIARQRQTIVDLTQLGADTRQAKQILDAMLVTLGLMIDHRDRIEAIRKRGSEAERFPFTVAGRDPQEAIERAVKEYDIAERECFRISVQREA